MRELETFFDNNDINVRLYAVNYQAKPFPDIDQENDVHIDCSDRIAEISHTENSLIIIFERSMRVHPDSIMELSVSFSSEHKLLPEYIGKMNWSEFDLEKEVMSNLPRFVPNEFARLSLIISQLTSSFEGQPLVTPPSCLIEQPDNAD